MKNVIKNIKNFISYIYYMKASLSSNVYPYKLVGQKFNSDNNLTIITYKINGIYQIQEIYLQDLIPDIKILEKFHPLDALKMGEISLNDTINLISEEKRRERYTKVCKAMLDLIHDASHKVITENFKPVNIEKLKQVYHHDIDLKNSYTCKLVGAKLSSSNFKEHKIIFTIFSKREGHEILLGELIKDKKLLTRFHPTDAIKIGYISAGRILLS